MRVTKDDEDTNIPALTGRGYNPGRESGDSGSGRRESMKRVVGNGVVLLLLSMVSLGAGRSEVADAVMRGDRPAARKLVEQHADVNVPQADGATALHWAVFRSDKAMVDLLLRAGANPKAANREGSTPLWLASTNGDAAILEALLKAGADA